MIILPNVTRLNEKKMILGRKNQTGDTGFNHPVKIKPGKNPGDRKVFIYPIEYYALTGLFKIKSRNKLILSLSCLR